MSETTTEAVETPTETTESVEVEAPENTESTESTEQAPVEYPKDSWQATLVDSAKVHERAGKAKNRASVLLWKGAKAGIADWLETDADDDTSGENLYEQVINLLGSNRRGDASKIRTVAVATKVHGLDITKYPNLSQAYAEATRLTKTVVEHKAEDDAADKAVEAIAAEAPKTASTTESAAQVLLAKGLDEAARALLDALGSDNFAAHRSLLRAVSDEIAGRVKPKKAEPKSNEDGEEDGEKSGAAKATTTKAAPVAKKAAPTKAKVAPTTTKAAPTKAAPVAKKAVPSVSKGDPNRRPLPKAAPKAAPKAE